MKIIHVTDIHVTLGEAIEGCDPQANLAACLAHIATHHADAERVIITGDLTHYGQPEAYERLKEMLDGFPLADRTRLLIGNHDDRANFQAAFPDAARDENGFVQGADETPAGTFLYLDTVQPLTHAGHYDAPRLAWLREQLARADRAYIFMHHPPRLIGVVAEDVIGMQDAAPLRRVLENAQDRVAHIFHGHCHLPITGNVAGIAFTGIRGTNHQGWADFSNNPKLTSTLQPPAYAVLQIDETTGELTHHTIDFLYDGPFVKDGTDGADWKSKNAA